MSATFGAGPDAPFIARKAVPNSEGKRVLAVGRIRGGSVLVQLSARFSARFGDLQATGTREAAQLERLRRDGFRAWDIHHGQRGDQP